MNLRRIHKLTKSSVSLFKITIAFESTVVSTDLSPYEYMEAVKQGTVTPKQFKV
ncbi:hypothetical protein ACFPYJ_14950 [Paenibacillus solisilvae]|uniref:Uncharacterized protein n=1 Tax=Paenibacillus solisilvae TaxID=2486751 RepID=A0ABW0W1V7_9BACL